MANTAPTTKNILVIAGDPSGDLHAANLIKALRAKDPEISVTSMGGVRMQEVSTHFIYNLVSVGAVGFAEPFKNFFLWLKLIKLARRYMEEKRPACVIAVDFYGFNYQMLGLASHRKIPAFYYISPQVWASRPGRAAKIAKLTKEIFVIFPFEEALYKKAGGNATFVGHPLLDLIPEPADRPVPPPDGAWNIGILPGSRKAEISRHLPIFLKAFYRIKEEHPKAKAFVFAVPEFPDERLVPELEAVDKYWSKDVEIVRESDYKQRAQLDFAFTCSGTATLENGLLGVPMAVAYKMPRFTWEIAKRVANVQYVSLVNILLKRPAVKELLQEKATADLLAQEAFSFLNNPSRIRAVRKELTGLRALLGNRGAAERAAERILPYLS
ncbi:MAG TPA: lipid-A-disaccharide synthase [Elusimicrobiales bacterium]|nr:lipid-A-disaccharide synthase [Elusimicrobiales bacterium]